MWWIDHSHKVFVISQNLLLSNVLRLVVFEGQMVCCKLPLTAYHLVHVVVGRRQRLTKARLLLFATFVGIIGIDCLLANLDYNLPISELEDPHKPSVTVDIPSKPLTSIH
jgi:hypothetical protein